MEATEVRKELSKYFRFSFRKKVIILTDTEYDDVPMNDFIDAALELSTDNGLSASYSCEDFAREAFYKLRKEHVGGPIGIVLMSKVGGKKMFHAKIVCVTKDAGVLLLEPQTMVFNNLFFNKNKVEKAVKGKDVFIAVYI